MRTYTETGGLFLRQDFISKNTNTQPDYKKHLSDLNITQQDAEKAKQNLLKNFKNLWNSFANTLSIENAGYLTCYWLEAYRKEYNIPSE